MTEYAVRRPARRAESRRGDRSSRAVPGRSATGSASLARLRADLLAGARVAQLASLQRAQSTGSTAADLERRSALLNRGTVQRRAGFSGMPAALQTGLEALSGVSLAGTRVVYNSPRPAQLNALAYTRNDEVHLGPGQERHLPHEGWHLVQQRQGRVQPTTRSESGVPINDSRTLEREADVMGRRAVRSSRLEPPAGREKS